MFKFNISFDKKKFENEVLDAVKKEWVKDAEEKLRKNGMTFSEIRRLKINVDIDKSILNIDGPKELTEKAKQILGNENIKRRIV